MLQRLLTLTLLFAPSLAFGQTYWGDYQDTNQTEYMYFPTSDAEGAKATLTSGALACYENGSATQFTSGLTLDNDFDSVTGFHQIAVDFSDANFEAGKTYTIALTAGTVDGVAVTGSPLVTFSAGRYASAPTNYSTLAIDASGRVQIQDGTSAGQIDTNAGAVVAVTTAASVTNTVNANVVQLSGDATAADNSEAFFDGTGYAGTGNTIPTVTTVTNGVNVTQFGGTNGTFASGRPQVNASHIGGTQVENKTWFVKGTGGSNANTGASRGQAFSTIANAMTEANPGDTIYLCAGTITEQVIVTKRLTFDGDGSAASTLNYSSGNTLDIQASGVVLRNLKVIASGTSNVDTGVYCFGYRDPTIDRCHIVGKFDGLTVFQCQNVNVTNTTITGTYDGVNDSGSTGYFGNCTISTDCSWASDVDMRAVFGGGDFITTKQAQTRRMVYDNCGFAAARTGTSAGGKYTAAFAAPGMTEFRGYCTFVATASNASYTGNVYGVIPEGRVSASFNLPGECRITGGMVYTSTAGSGTAYDLRASNASAALFVNAMSYDAAKTNGTVIDESLKPTVAGRKLDVSSGGEAGLDWANIGSPTTTVGLSGTTVATVSTLTGHTPQTGDSFARIGATGSGLTTLSTQASVNTIDGIIDNIYTGMELDGSVYRFTTNALEQAPSGGGGGSMAWADLVADNDDVAGSFGKAIADILVDTGTSIPDQLDEIAAGVANAEPDDRDLEPVQHTWQLKRSGDGTLRSTNPLYVVAGTEQTIRAGWNCDIPSILPGGTVISTESEPVLVVDSSDVEITHIGHGEKVAKVELLFPDSAVAGSHWVKTTITNTNGGGPVAVFGEVIIQAEPE